MTRFGALSRAPTQRHWDWDRLLSLISRLVTFYLVTTLIMSTEQGQPRPLFVTDDLINTIISLDPQERDQALHRLLSRHAPPRSPFAALFTFRIPSFLHQTAEPRYNSRSVSVGGWAESGSGSGSRSRLSQARSFSTRRPNGGSRALFFNVERWIIHHTPSPSHSQLSSSSPAFPHFIFRRDKDDIVLNMLLARLRAFVNSESPCEEDFDLIWRARQEVARVDRSTLYSYNEQAETANFFVRAGGAVNAFMTESSHFRQNVVIPNAGGGDNSVVADVWRDQVKDVEYRLAPKVQKVISDGSICSKPYIPTEHAVHLVEIEDKPKMSDRQLKDIVEQAGVSFSVGGTHDGFLVQLENADSNSFSATKGTFPLRLVQSEVDVLVQVDLFFLLSPCSTTSIYD